jgi:hypothetical protein
MSRAVVRSIPPKEYTPRLRNFVASYGDDLAKMDDPLVLAELTRILHGGSRRGDIVKIRELAGCDNNWTYIFDGRQVVPLARDPTLDEFGYVPASFRVLEEGGFGPKYWSEAVAHNRIIWFDARPFLSQIRRSFDPYVYARYVGAETFRRYPEFPPDFLGRVEPFARFDHQGQTYLLALDFYVIGDAGDAPGLARRALGLAEEGAQPWNWYEGITPQAERVILAGHEMLGWD